MKRKIEFLLLVSKLSHLLLLIGCSNYLFAQNKSGNENFEKKLLKFHIGLNDSIIDYRKDPFQKTLLSEYILSGFTYCNNIVINKALVIESYANNVKDGPFYIYFNDTILHLVGFYENGRLNGCLQFFKSDVNNVLLCSAIKWYNNGSLNGPSIYGLSFSPHIAIYNQGELHGVFTNFTESGDVESIRHYDKGGQKYSRTFDVEDSSNFIIINENTKEIRSYKNSVWKETAVVNKSRRDGLQLKIPTKSQRLFDYNRFYLFLHKKRLNKMYNYNFKIRWY